MPSKKYKVGTQNQGLIFFCDFMRINVVYVLLSFMHTYVNVHLAVTK